MAPFLVRENAYRAARPVGAVPSLAVRLSELIDSVALNSEAFAHHVRTWRGVGATNDELYALYDEMMSLANALRDPPEVTADPVRALATRLPGLSTADRATTLALLPPGTGSGRPVMPRWWKPCVTGSPRPSSPRSRRTS
ncbi:hypothetical protein [Streptomyces sp. WG7]|uniref:hypothetical protein n=1 Tax=Streptomyces sp. WG7 TaxID=3417650 RepID=UPI003CE6AF36